MKVSHIGAVLCCLVMVATWLPAQTESFASPTVQVHNEGEGIPVGPFIFSPSVELIWESRDNIFFTAANEVSDQVWLARARLSFELPIRNSNIRFTYTPQYRQYQDYDLRENWSHFFDVLGAFEFASGLEVDAGYRFVNGNLETQEIDPGRELVFGESQYDKQHFALGANYWFGPTNAVRVEGQYVDFAYSDTALLPGAPQTGRVFYNYSRLSYGAGWLHQVNPSLVFDVKLVREDFDTERTSYFRNSTADQASLGMVGQLTPVLSGELRIGWRKTDFKTRPGVRDVDDFSGFVADGTLRWDLAHGSQLALKVLRWDYASAYGNNAFYTATGGGISYHLNRDRFFGEVSVHLQNNDYDVTERSDDILNLGLGIGYRVTELLSLRGSYFFEDRDSLPEYSYEASFFLVGLIYGF